MKKQDIKSHARVHNEWNEVSVSIELPISNPDSTAEVVLTHFEEHEWIVTRCWAPEVYSPGVETALMEKAMEIVSRKAGFGALLVQPSGWHRDVTKEREFFKSLGFRETSYAPRVLEWRYHPQIRVVPAAEVLGHPTLSLLAQDYVDP